MRYATVSLLLSLLCMGAASGSPSSNEKDGISIDEFRNLAKTLPTLPGRIQAIQIFYDSTAHENAVAFATFDDKAGWQVSVFDPNREGGFKLAWQSGKLADSFAVSSQSELRVASLENEQAVQFEGCAAHVCPDVFSILLYVPSKHTVFTADYVWGKVTFSVNLDSVENSRYKSVLSNLVKRHKF